MSPAPHTCLRRNVLPALLAALCLMPGARAVLAGPMDTVRDVLGDTWYVVSAPSRMNASSALWTAGIVATGAVIYANDQAIHDAFRRNRKSEWYKAALYLGRRWEPVGNMGNTNVYYVGALGAGLALGAAGVDVPPLREVPGQILQSHLTAGGIRNLGKIAVGRRRPFEGGPRVFEPPNGTSFPSGHSSVAFELAAVLSHAVGETPASIPVSTVVHAAATSMALQRVDSDAHWASDVYFGAVFGAIAARTIVQRHAERAARRTLDSEASSAPRPRVAWLAPVLGRAHGLGLQLHVTF